MNELPPINRKKLAALLGQIKENNHPARRGKSMEMYCRGHCEACNIIAGAMLSGSLEGDE